MDKEQQKTTLRRRVLKGSMWLTAGSSAEQGLRFLRNIILARILAPESFGTMAIVLAVCAIFESFTEIGIKEGVIQNPNGHERSYLNAAWWIAAVRGLGLYAVGYAAAPMIEGFYGTPGLSLLTRVAFLGIVFNGTMSAGAYRALKDMKFNRWALLWNGGGVVGIVTAIGLTFFMRDVWALVIGFTVESATRCILSYVVCPFMPRLRFERESFRAIWGYSQGMFGLPILTFIFMRADIFVLGKLSPMAQLGLYTMAGSLARMPFEFVVSIAGRVMMPMFSEIQAERDRTNRLVIQITSAIAYLTFPALLFAALYGRDVLAIVYGSKYGAMAVPFALLFAAELLRVCSTPIATYYLASGRPALHRLFTTIRAAIMIVLLYPAVKWFGPSGAAAAGLVATAVGFAFQVRRMHGLSGLDLQGYASIFLRSSAISLVVVPIWVVTHNLLSAYPVARMFPGMVGCLLAYALLYRYFRNSVAMPRLFHGVRGANP